MNYVGLMGRLTRDPEIRYAQTSNLAIARYTLAVDRPKSSNQQGNGNEPTADFINCVAFDKTAEFANKYLRKGIKIAVEGSIRTGKYQNKDGQTVYTTEVIVNRHEFCESRAASQDNNSNNNSNGRAQGYGNPSGSYGYNNPNNKASAPADPVDDGFMNVPEGIDEELPFSG